MSIKYIGEYGYEHPLNRVETHVLDVHGVPIFTGDVVVAGTSIGPYGDTEYLYDVVQPIYYKENGQERVLYEPASYYKDGTLEIVGSVFSSTPEELAKWGIHM